MKVTELKSAMDAGFAEIDQRFEKADERFRTIDEQFADVRAQLEAMDRRITLEATATRRHFDVVAEDLKSDIRLLAGAVAAISTTLEHHITVSLSGRRTMSGALDDHEVRITVLEQRRS